MWLANDFETYFSSQINLVSGRRNGNGKRNGKRNGDGNGTDQTEQEVVKRSAGLLLVIQIVGHDVLHESRWSVKAELADVIRMALEAETDDLANLPFS